MRSQMEEILRLQPAWTSRNTPEMQRRGVLVRHEVADWLRSQLPDLASLVPPQVNDLAVQGRDGTGLKTEVPWVRVFSMSRSPSATDGFYAVYLFSGSGNRAYLSLNQGTTRWKGGEFRQRPLAELQERARWARESITHKLTERPDCHREIDLEASKRLGRGYQVGNIAAFEYQLGSVPTDAALRDDLAFMVGALGELYAFIDDALTVPGDTAPEVLDAERLVEETVRPRLNGHSGNARLRLSASERKAIEIRAVHVAAEHLEGQDWDVRDVGATQSYDLDARRGDERLFVEVKGTTSAGTEVILTRNEVDLNTRQYPDTALLVVTHIELDRKANPPMAHGGTLQEIHPWKIDTQDLEPIAFRYTVPQAND